ncbi:hypothetical protein E2562_022378 [Oryza meyeriana var. granulata]|uniref:Uncharacterized protein n=1 Tax=Oryza meyeriana var. granulata TaxID=110450 RepID=A0A6G1DM17_9ORYZ|nr:hypothetical protein E2562_022378 [Oryza meyeriana var. granulata]
MPQRMAHNARASGSGQPCDVGASGNPGPRTGEIGLEAWPVPWEGDARSPPARMKKTTLTHERHPFASTPWGFTSPKPR